MTPEIEALRQKLDLIEDKLISLLNERAKCVLEIGKIKHEKGLPIEDPKRQRLILNRVVQKNSNPISDEFIKNIFKKIIEESIKLEKQR